MIKNCVLCDEKIVNKRCSGCGMDYSRWEEHYHLNEEGCLECGKKRQTVNQYKVPVQNQNRTRSMTAHQRLKEQANKKVRKEYGASKQKKKGKKAGIVLCLVWLIFILVSYVTSEVSDEIREPEVIDMEGTDSSYEYDPYEYVVDEMPEDGEYYEIELGKGSYYGAEQIPAGVYTITLFNDDGYGNIGIYDDRNQINVLEYLDCDGKKEFEDVRIFEGTQLEVEGNIRVALKSDNAQMDSMKEAKQNPLENSVEVTGTMVAGEDFEPGWYDVYVISGYGTLSRTMAGVDYYDWYTWLNCESAEESVYYNKEFLPGDTIEFAEYCSEDFAVGLIPCAEVYQ